MADVNKVILIGRLTRDPQLKYTPSQMAICEFGLAVGRKYRKASGETVEESNFVDCALFGKGGEVFNQYMKKGRQVYLEGRLKFDQWEDRQGGGKRSKLSVVVENFQFLDGGSGGPGGGGPDYSNAEDEYAGRTTRGGNDAGQAPRSGFGRQPANKAEPEPPFGDEQQFGDDDIPF